MLGDAFNSAVMELNASNDRGIDVVRNKIKMFAQQKCTLPQGKHKIIILDEADSMTEGAQQVRKFLRGLYRIDNLCRLCEELWRFIQKQHDLRWRAIILKRLSSQFNHDAPS